jgi:hypothetical protein
MLRASLRIHLLIEHRVIIDRFNDYMCGAIIVQRKQKSILCLKSNGMKVGLFVKENLKNLILVNIRNFSILQFIPKDLFIQTLN